MDEIKSNLKNKIDEDIPERRRKKPSVKARETMEEDAGPVVATPKTIQKGRKHKSKSGDSMSPATRKMRARLTDGEYNMTFDEVLEENDDQTERRAITLRDLLPDSLCDISTFRPTRIFSVGECVSGNGGTFMAACDTWRGVFKEYFKQDGVVRRPKELDSLLSSMPGVAEILVINKNCFLPDKNGFACPMCKRRSMIDKDFLGVHESRRKPFSPVFEYGDCLHPVHYGEYLLWALAAAAYDHLFNHVSLPTTMTFDLSRNHQSD